MTHYKDPTAEQAIANVSRRGYHKGEVYYIRKRNEQDSKLGVIVSSDRINAQSPCVEVAYLVDTKPKLPAHATVECDKTYTVLCEQIHTLRKNRFGKLIKKCTKTEMKAIKQALWVSFFGID